MKITLKKSVNVLGLFALVSSRCAPFEAPQTDRERRGRYLRWQGSQSVPGDPHTSEKSERGSSPPEFV